jgi:predicted CXXCH cytochrome family protein
MRLRPIALVVFLLLLGAGAVAAVEHPGVLHEGDDCSSCDASKTTGAFGDGEPVYDLSSGSNSRRHDDSALNLPKEQICLPAHEKSAELRRHTSVVQERCVECHDSHSSERRMLLREVCDLRDRGTTMLPPDRERAHRPTSARP